MNQFYSLVTQFINSIFFPSFTFILFSSDLRIQNVRDFVDLSILMKIFCKTFPRSKAYNVIFVNMNTVFNFVK